jgi:hypothetical protein
VNAANQESGEGEQTTFKAFWNMLRLSRDDKSPGRSTMNWSMKRTLLGSVASVCVLAFGAVMLWPVFTHRGELPTVQEPVRMDIAPVPEARKVPEQPVAAKPVPQPVPESHSASLIGETMEEVKVAQSERQKTNGASLKKDEQAEQVVVTGNRGVATSFSASAPMVLGDEKYSAESYAPGYPQGQESDDRFAHFDVNPVKACCRRRTRYASRRWSTTSTTPGRCRIRARSRSSRRSS